MPLNPHGALGKRIIDAAIARATNNGRADWQNQHRWDNRCTYCGGHHIVHVEQHAPWVRAVARPS